MLDNGADIVDMGGESTRPGAETVPADVEISRVIPPIRSVREARPDALISVDTSKAAVASAAIEAGAGIVNDVTGGADPEMLPTVASSPGCAMILMHMRGTPRTMQHDTTYHNVVDEVCELLLEAAHRALSLGIPRELVWLDPGIGFGKDLDGNLKLLAHLPELAASGHPIVVGPSRKSFIGRLTGASVEDRLPGTLAALQPGIDVERCVLRVHDPRAAHQYLTVAAGIRNAR
jgi:dihydropteroate synthase